MNNNTINLISWNVNGIRALQKKGLVNIINQLNVDIFALQEIKANKEQLSEDLINIPGYESYWHSAEKKGYSGVAVYSKIKPISVIKGFEVPELNFEGRTIILEFNNFYFLNVYFPNAQEKLKRIDWKLKFNNSLLEFLNKLRKKKNIIICGDFNVAHKEIDLKNPKENEMNPGYSIQERNWLNKFIENDYIDTFRIFNKEPENYTWWSYRFKAREKNIGWRIDYFFVNKSFSQNVKNAYILKDIMGSDHCPIGLQIKI